MKVIHGNYCYVNTENHNNFYTKHPACNCPLLEYNQYMCPGMHQWLHAVHTIVVQVL